MSAVPGSICSNRRVYESAEVVEQYASMAGEVGLFPSEQAILQRLWTGHPKGTVLDVGVGAGRTTQALSAAFANYIGVDYAASMVNRCRELFPALDFRAQDARALAFPDLSFDSVWFSFNGIDYVPLEDRMDVLREAARVVRPGGTFVFSTHNLLAPPRPPARWPEWRRDGSLLRRGASHARRLLRHAYWHVNYRRFKRREVHGHGCSLLIDSAHGYRLMTAFVTPAWQLAQLRLAGFDDVEVVAQDGRVLLTTERPGDSWLYYVARKSR